MSAAPGKPFDLNIEEVLEHWGVSEAIRELIANALDEQALTGSDDPVIEEVSTGRWRIRDWGRGLRYEHFTQKEDPEKLKKANLVIGKFGFGLKDAVGALDRRGVDVHFSSRHAEISVERLPKHGFEEIKTLHAVVRAPADPAMPGTRVTLDRATREQVEAAKRLFLRFSGDEELEGTRYGAVLRRGTGPARIYVNGLRVAEEPNFLFSYNITSLTQALRDELNRERTNVGRQAYSDRVKAILKACTSEGVAGPLAEDLAGYQAGRIHDENSWLDVSLHACKILNSTQKVVFIRFSDQHLLAGHVEKARDDGFRIVVVPDQIAARLPTMKDLAGQPIRDLHQFLEEWNETFQYDFVDPEAMTPRERVVFALVEPALALAKRGSRRVKEVRISNTMRLSAYDRGETLGVWDPETGRIVIRREELRTREQFLGTLLHEVAHAMTEAGDIAGEFEDGLTRLLGMTASAALNPPHARG